MKITNKHNLPQPVVDALTADDYSRGESNRSVTQLIDSPRYRILKHEHADEISMDASELVWIALGKGVHKMFEEHAGGRWNPEERLFADVSGWTVSGQIDIQHLDEDNGNVFLYDYKVTSVWSVIFGKDSYAKQLNFYAWLVRQTRPGTHVAGLRIVFILRDWRMRDSMTKADYPKSPIMVLDVPLWSEDEAEKYVLERVRLHQEAEFNRLTGDVLPNCTDEERWKRESKFAVKKPANKTAKRVFSSFEEAQQYIVDNKLEGFEIEERPDEPTRCALGYCPVNQWCDQWQAEINDA